MLSTFVALLVLMVPQEPATEDPRVAALTRALQGDAAARKAAAEALGKLGASASTAVPALTKALGDSDPELRRRAAWTLGRIGPKAKTAVHALSEALSDEHVRHLAAAALGRIGPDAKNAVPALIAALRVRKQGLRDVVALALGRIGSDAAAAIPALIAAMGSRDDLCNVYGWALDDPSHHDSYPALVELLIENPGPDVEWWSDGDHRHREFDQFQVGMDGIDHIPVASWALWRLGPAAIPPILECLTLARLGDDTDDSLKRYANYCLAMFGAHALAKFGAQAKAAIPALLGLVESDLVIWGDALEPVLVGIGTAAISELAHAAADKDRSISAWARAVLAKISEKLGPDDLPSLREIIRQGDATARFWAESMVRDIEARRGK